MVERRKTLVEGKPVTITWDPDEPAKLIKLGMEQSEVKLTDGRTRFVLNKHLEQK